MAREVTEFLKSIQRKNFRQLFILSDRKRKALGLLMLFLKKKISLVVANDTSFIHIGIAFKVPTICPIMNSYLGVDSLYGYKKINRWVINENEKGPESLKRLPSERVIETIEEVLHLEIKEKDKFLLFYNA